MPRVTPLSIARTQTLLNPAYRELEARLLERDENKAQEEKNDPGDDPPRRNVVNQRFVSTTDPEASVVRKGKGKAKLHYQTHRGIDGAYGVITATVVGPGDENEAHRLRDLIEAHQDHTRRNVEVVVADSKYGTTANFFDCHDHGITAHIPVLKQTQDQQERRRKIFLRVGLFTILTPIPIVAPRDKPSATASTGYSAKRLNTSPRGESVSNVAYVPNAPNPRAVDALSNATSARSCWIVYVTKPAVRQRDEISGYVSISWRAHLPKPLVSV